MRDQRRVLWSDDAKKHPPRSSHCSASSSSLKVKSSGAGISHGTTLTVAAHGGHIRYIDIAV